MKYDAIEYILDGNWFYGYYQQMRNNKREIDAHIFCKKSIEAYEKALSILSKTAMPDLDIGLKLEDNLALSRNIERTTHDFMLKKVKSNEPRNDAVSQYNYNFLCGYICAEQLDRFDTVDKQLEWLGHAIEYYSSADEIYNNATDSERYAIKEESLSLEPAKNFLYASQAKYKHLERYLKTQLGDSILQCDK
jgi:hypothetical protein